MKYLSLDAIDIESCSIPDELKCISITMRGTKNLFDIFFSANDVEVSFDITLPTQIDFTWINTPSGKEKYLSYTTLKRMLFPLNNRHKLISPYLNWVDSLLFIHGKAKPFFRNTYAASNDSTDILDESISDLDDVEESESISSFTSVQDNEYLITALQHKVDQLEHEIEIKNKDITILMREVQLRDKEIEILKLKLAMPATSIWV